MVDWFDKIFFAPTTLKGVLSGLKQLLTTERPIKTMKNAFYFTFRLLFLRYLNFCSDF